LQLTGRPAANQADSCYLERYIENKREDLGSNLQELEQKVKSVTDWRQQVQNNPMTIIGAAFGGGVLLVSMKADEGGTVMLECPTNRITPHAGTDEMTHKVIETWDRFATS